MEKKCRYCAMMIPKDAKICPHCRKKFGWTWPAKIVMGLLALGIIGSFVGKQGTDTKAVAPVKSTSIPASAKKAANDPGNEIQEKFTLVDWGWERGEYNNNYISGTVKNNTNKTYGYAQISFSLHDEDGAQVGSAMANINNLEARGTWKFKAIVLTKTATKAKFKGISAF